MQGETERGTDAWCKLEAVMQVCKCNKRRSVAMRAACAISLVAGTWLGASPAFAAAPAPVEFDWSVTTGNGVGGTGNGGASSAYTPAPILTDQSVASVVAFLS